MKKDSSFVNEQAHCPLITLQANNKVDIKDTAVS